MPIARALQGDQARDPSCPAPPRLAAAISPNTLNLGGVPAAATPTTNQPTEMARFHPTKRVHFSTGIDSQDRNIG
jgi:hypothetical protein